LIENFLEKRKKIFNYLHLLLSFRINIIEGGIDLALSSLRLSENRLNLAFDPVERL